MAKVYSFIKHTLFWHVIHTMGAFHREASAKKFQIWCQWNFKLLIERLKTELWILVIFWLLWFHQLFSEINSRIVVNIFNSSRKVKNRLLVALNSKKQKDFPLKRRRNNDKYRYLMMRIKLRNLAFDQKFTVINFWESHVVSHVYSSLWPFSCFCLCF